MGQSSTLYVSNVCISLLKAMAVLSYDLTFRIFLFDICNVMIRESKNSTCLSNNKNALKHINSYTVMPFKIYEQTKNCSIETIRILLCSVAESRIFQTGR